MLYLYPLPTTESNWLHVLVLDCVEEVFRGVAESVAVRPWTSFIPADKSSLLESARGFGEHYERLLDKARDLTSAEAGIALEQIRASRSYDDVLHGRIPYPKLSLVPPVMDALRGFLRYAFGQLSRISHVAHGLSIRDSRYKEVFDSASFQPVCPFCGTSRLEAPFPIMPRHALDHYLSFNGYPLYASHLKNLVTMCDRCNSSFKGAKDMMLTAGGQPRRCIDPHSGPTVTVSLAGSVPFAGSDGFRPAWNINLLPSGEEVDTWAEVFRIRERYEQNILNLCYNDWVQEFASFLQLAERRIDTVSDLSAILSRYASSLSSSGDIAFLKSAAFEMLSDVSSSSNELGTRLLNVIKSLMSFD